MPSRSLYVRVGLLLTGTAALLVAMVFVFTGDRLAKGKQFETYFRESVQGLDVGAPVKYRGVALGQVTGIGLVAAEYGATAEDQVMDPQYRLIVVRFKVNPKRIGKLPDTASAVAHGLRAKLANQGLTGVMFLELDFLPPEDNAVAKLPWVPRDDYIPSVPSTISQVQDAIQSVLAKFQAIDFSGLAGNVNGLVQDLRREMQPDGDVHATLDSARATIGVVRDQILQADLPALGAQLRKTGAAVAYLADGGPTHLAVARAAVALDKLPALIASLQTLSNRAGAGVGDIQAELMPILEQLAVTAQNLREASEAIKRDPGSLLLGGPPPRHAR
jgi:ABC-type transporter Mla subunit MlaD